MMRTGLRYGLRGAAGVMAAGVAVALSPGAARGSIIVNFQQVGGNVVITGAGTANTAGLSFLFSSNSQTVIDASSGQLQIGTAGVPLWAYITISGPANFGTNTSFSVATSGSGDFFGLTSFNHRLFLPSGYISNTPLAATSTYAGQTFASLGLTLGTYVYSWGAGANADTLTINIPGVPAPGVGGVAAASVLMLAARRRRR